MMTKILIIVSELTSGGCKDQIKLNPLGISSKGKEKLLFPLIYQEED